MYPRALHDQRFLGVDESPYRRHPDEHFASQFGKQRRGELMARPFDAVVVGSGVNGLVAAAELAKAGWSVALVERNDRLGGFIATEERTVPGYLHDTYS